MKDGDIDTNDIKDIMFDVFRGRNKFTYHFSERFWIYFMKLEPFLGVLNAGSREKLDIQSGCTTRRKVVTKRNLTS